MYSIPKEITSADKYSVNYKLIVLTDHLLLLEKHKYMPSYICRCKAYQKYQYDVIISISELDCKIYKEVKISYL